MGNIVIRGGRVVLPYEIVEADIVVDNGRIAAILTDSSETDSISDQNVTVIDAAGKYVLPGLIDIHCDAIEKEVQPRPNTLFPLDTALIEFERKLPVHGITTMYHSLSFGVGLSLRGDHLLTGMIEQIHRYRSRRAAVRHGIHLRYEVSHLGGLQIVERYIRERKIDYLSFMDHSPGQGQYKEQGSFERYVMKNQGVDAIQVQEIVRDLLERRHRVDWTHLQNLGRLAADNGISVASHDDDTPERVKQFMEFGVRVSEFPLTADTAAYAAKQGLYVCVGAPNVVRGGSHDNNMRAVDAIGEGTANILCSDYYPASLLAAVFKLDRDGITDLAAAVRMASLHPAQALGINGQRGAIEPGKQADMIIVDTAFEGYPIVTHTVVNGTVVYESKTYYSN